MTSQQRLIFPFLLVLLFLAGCAGQAPKLTDFAINMDRKKAGLERHEIDLPDGLHYAYLAGGKGDVLMLLHGFGGNKDNFTRVSGDLIKHYRVIIPDHIGFGESTHLQDGDYTPAAQAKRLHAFAQALNIKDVHLGGNSMGGQIAMAYAELYRDEVKSLWLLDPAGIWEAPKSEFAEIYQKTGKNPLIIRSEDDFANAVKFAMSDPPFAPRPILNTLAQERIRNADLEEKIFQQIVNDPSMEKRIKDLPIPTLIVWGTEDRVIHPGPAEILHKLLPNSKVILLQDTGHMPMLEQPGTTAWDYVRFRKNYVAKLKLPAPDAQAAK